ncbi:MAG: hypothetical protein ABGZ35_31600 [Planctomycetaceae bacterium]
MKVDASHKLSHQCLHRLMMLCCFFVTMTGCTIFEPNIAQMFKKEPEIQTPHQMIPLWTDTVLHQSGKKSVRGCGGRFMFYTGDSKEGIRVEGAVTVYVWDDSRSSQQRKPDRKYIFPAENIQKHYSKSRVGHSYSFWIPWDDAGSDRAELSIVTRFIGRDGTDITTPASKVILPGPISMPDAQMATGDQNDGDGEDANNEGIQQVSWDRKQRRRSSVRRTLRSSVIQVGPGFVKRNQQSQTDGLSAFDLFSEPDMTQPHKDNGDASMHDLPTSDDSDVDGNAEEAEANLFNGTASARRAARLLRSRFQARRERVAQRSASAAGTQPSLATER